MAEVTTVERVREFLKPWEGRCLVCGWTLGTSCTTALCRYVGRDREQRVTLPASLLAELVVERERLAASFDQVKRERNVALAAADMADDEIDRIVSARTPQQWADMLAALPPETQDRITDALVERDVAWGTDVTRSRATRNAALLARAEQAEHSLAASERDLSELRTRITDLVAAWGPPTHGPDACPSVAAGVGPCFRCAVSAAVARATQAERDRDAWRAKWEALETTRAVCCDQMERERDEARAERDAAVTRLVGARVARESAIEDAEALRSRLAKTERARERLTDGLKSAAGLDHTGPGSASFSRIFPEDTYPTNGKEADAFVKARMRLWFTTWIVTPMQDALRALDAPYDSPVGVAATARRCGACLGCGILPSEAGEYCHAPCRECGGSGLVSPATLDPQAPATRAEFEALRRRVERLESTK